MELAIKLKGEIYTVYCDPVHKFTKGH